MNENNETADGLPNVDVVDHPEMYQSSFDS